MPLRWSRTRMGRGSAAWGWFTRHGIRVGHKPRNFVGPGGVYLNVSQFPLESERYFRLIKSSGDMDLVFFIHDLLPLQMPEYFKPREHALHRRRLQNLARFARAAIVSSNVVKEALERHLLSLGRIDMPILVAPLPVDPIFSQRIEAPEQSARPYFLMCGTIEPRKNHLLVLHVWRRLVEEMGEQAPTLVLVGARGWENEHIVDLLERCPNLQKHVVEISGLETPALRRLLAGACAALMPTFAEGYGLPLVEALAAGTPVIASDIQVFREIGGDHVIRLDPTDGPAWLRTIRDFAAAPSPLRRSRVKALADYRPPSWTTFFARIEDFVADFDNR